MALCLSIATRAEWGRGERPQTQELQTQQNGWGRLLRPQTPPRELCVSHQGVPVAPAHKEAFPTEQWGVTVKLLAERGRELRELRQRLMDSSVRIASLTVRPTAAVLLSKGWGQGSRGANTRLCLSEHLSKDGSLLTPYVRNSATSN